MHANCEYDINYKMIFEKIITETSIVFVSGKLYDIYYIHFTLYLHLMANDYVIGRLLCIIHSFIIHSVAQSLYTCKLNPRQYLINHINNGRFFLFKYRQL